MSPATTPRSSTSVSRELDRLEAEGEESKRIAEALKTVETGGEITPESETVREQLKALGYVEE